MKHDVSNFDVLETPYHTGQITSDPNAPPESLHSRRWNLGAGNRPLDGYTNLDRKTGQEIYPLLCPDGSLDEIRASHCLEHFSHTKIHEILKHWHSKLRPGGRLRVAVPDFEWCCRRYLAGEAIPIQSYVMGGHTHEDDHHGTIFDREALVEGLIDAGFERIGPWRDEAQDCSNLEVSLNLQGYRPVSDVRKVEHVVGIMSAPRFGPIMHYRAAFLALSKCRIPYMIGQGAYWHQVLAELMEKSIQRQDAKYILTLDYDSIFSADEVTELYRLMEAFPEVDCVAGLQMRRTVESQPLFGLVDANGKARSQIPADDLGRNLLPVSHAHFGLTLFRRESLDKLPRPWFTATPGKGGSWASSSDKVDPDIQFWRDWRNAGLSLYLAPKVPVGHIAEVILWPGEGLETVYQSLSDYEDQGVPAEARR